jgi:hypothetical protein
MRMQTQIFHILQQYACFLLSVAHQMQKLYEKHISTLLVSIDSGFKLTIVTQKLKIFIIKHI